MGQEINRIFGCGPGQTTKYLTDLGIEASGLDLSGEILAHAITNHPEINFRKGNILELEFNDDSIGGIVAFYAIVHFTTEQVESVTTGRAGGLPNRN